MSRIIVRRLPTPLDDAQFGTETLEILTTEEDEPLLVEGLA